MHKRIGDFLLEKKAITEAQLKEILEYSAKSGLRLGDAAMEMGILDRDKMLRLFGRNYRVDFFSLQPEYYPEVTRGLLTSDQILKYGVLPLGYKSETEWLVRKVRRLNLGILNPEREDSIRTARDAARVSRTKLFLVLPDEFLRLIEKIYGVTEAEILSRKPGETDSVISMFMQRGV